MTYNPAMTEHSAVDINGFNLAREKSSHIVKAAKSATIANILAPLLCIPMFRDQVDAYKFDVWLSYMAVVVAVRTMIVFSMPTENEQIVNHSQKRVIWNRQDVMVVERMHPQRSS